MVTGIPKPYRSSRELRDFFVQLYGEETVVSASVVPHVESLHNLWLDYKKLQAGDLLLKPSPIHLWTFLRLLGVWCAFL